MLRGKGLFWTAPEILRNPLPPRNGTQKADVYSVGVLLYNIIYRLPPFHTDSDHVALPRGITDTRMYIYVTTRPGTMGFNNFFRFLGFRVFLGFN